MVFHLIYPVFTRLFKISLPFSICTQKRKSANFKTKEMKTDFYESLSQFADTQFLCLFQDIFQFLLNKSFVLQGYESLSQKRKYIFSVLNRQASIGQIPTFLVAVSHCIH